MNKSSQIDGFVETEDNWIRQFFIALTVYLNIGNDKVNYKENIYFSKV